MRRLAVLLALAGCSDDQPCDDASGACVVIGVSSASIAAIDELELDVSYGAEHHTTTITADGGGQMTLPVITGLELTPEEPVIVSVVGAGKLDGVLLGVSFDETAPLLDGQRAMLALRLVPVQACTAGGTYCGDVVAPGHPGSRYRCELGRVPILVERCATTCTTIADGQSVCD